MFRSLRCPALALVCLGGLFPALGEDGFVPLFNGKDFSGWVNVNCAPSTWSFDEEGLLVCTGKPIGELRTERMYQNFILELEWRHLVPKGNAGVFVWADDITARGQPFIRGVEIQILENAYGNTERYTTHGDIFPIHGAKMTPTNGRGGMRSFPTQSLSNPSPEWNHYRIECRDGTVKLSVNGTKVNEGRDCIPRKGYICLESEGGIVHYRNVRLKELPDTPIDPDHVAIENRGYRCLYTGVDLSGWKQDGDGWRSRDWTLFHPADASPSRLETEESFGDVGFVFDFLLFPESTALRFYPRGGGGPVVSFDPTLPGLEKTGRYNRIEGEIRGNALTLTPNGNEDARLEISLPRGNGHFAFEAEGKLELANPYVRALDREN